MFDDQPGRFDHKLVKAEEEDNRIFENYAALEESVYCAAKNSCGATIPLYKQFNYAELDSTYSTNNISLPFCEVYPKKPLCYIWPANYIIPADLNATEASSKEKTNEKSEKKTTEATDFTTEGKKSSTEDEKKEENANTQKAALVEDKLATLKQSNTSKNNESEATDRREEDSTKHPPSSKISTTIRPKML